MKKKYEVVYLDMDGVVADFDGHFENLYGVTPQEYEDKYGQTEFWQRVYESPTFFRDMKPMLGWIQVVKKCKELGEKVIILSSPSRTNQPLCMLHKRQWLDHWFGDSFPAIFESKKEKYARPGVLLIDDTPKKVQRFADAGGDVHLFTDCESFVDAY